MIKENTNLIVVNTEVWSKDMSVLLDPQTVKISDNIQFNGEKYTDFFTLIANHMSYIGSVVIKKSIWDSRQKEKYYNSWFVHVGVVFQDVLDGIEVKADPMIMIRYGNASWSAKSFEISLFRWPELIWSFDLFSDNTKRKVVSRFPWKNLARISLFRAVGAFSRKEYSTFIKNKLPFHQKFFFLCITFVPCFALNFLFLICFNILRWKHKKFKLQIHDLKNSCYYYKNILKKFRFN